MMKNLLKILFLTLIVTFFASNGAAYAGSLGSGKMQKNVCNPCGNKMKNPCNPCGRNSVKPLRKGNITDYSKLVAKGKRLWNDENLGKSGLSCMGCHAGYNLLNPYKVESFPHYVSMPDDILTLDQMINFCMINPMKSKRIDPYSIEMTSMAAYYQTYIKSYKRPKNVCNPCGKRMKNPCGE